MSWAEVKKISDEISTVNDNIVKNAWPSSIVTYEVGKGSSITVTGKGIVYTAGYGIITVDGVSTVVGSSTTIYVAGWVLFSKSMTLTVAANSSYTGKVFILLFDT